MKTHVNTMTILGGINNDDQQVPSATSTAVDIAGHLNQNTKKTTIPDFHNLLLNCAGSLDTPDLIPKDEFQYPEDSTAFMEKPFSAITWGLEVDVSMYDSTPMEDKKPKLEDLDVKPSMALSPAPSLSPVRADQMMSEDLSSVKLEPFTPEVQQQVARPSFLELSPALSPAPVHSNCTTPCSTGSLSPESPEVDEGILQECEMQKEKMATMCTKLLIPKDPYHWNVDQVQKWGVWVLREYYNLEYSCIPDFCMDGTSLCMLSQEDFINRSHDVGYFLFAELEWWKTVIMSEKQDECQDELTYTDLSSSSLSPSPMAALTPTANLIATSMDNILSIPAPVQATSMNCQQPMTMSAIPAPVLSTLDETSSTLNQINLEVQNYHHHQHQQYIQQMAQQYPTSSLSPAPSWEDNDSGCVTSSPDYNCGEAMDDEDDEEMMPEPTKRHYVSHSKHTIHLWQFLKDLLLTPEYNGTYIKWLDSSKGIFKIEDSAEVARLWGKRKNRPAMNYDKLSRSIRQYYKKGIIKKTSQSKRLVYQFQPNYL